MKSTNPERNLIIRLRHFFSEHSINNDDSILVGYSGGTDSTALVSILQVMGFRNLTALHIDHGIRPAEETRAENRFTMLFTDKLGIPCRLVTLQNGLLEREAKKTKRSLEEIAREYRYRILKDQAFLHGCRYIFTAHTLDDQFETMIMRFFQGGTLSSIKGIPEQSGNILRPFLKVEKTLLSEFLQFNGIAFFQDSTNIDQRFLRNAVRSRLIPVIESVFPGYRRALMELQRKIQISANISTDNRQCGDFSIPLHRWKNMQAWERINAVYGLYQKTESYTKNRRLPFRFLRTVLEERPEDGWKGLVLEGHGIMVKGQGTQIIGRKQLADPPKITYFTHLEIGEPVIIGDTEYELKFAENHDSVGKRYLFYADLENDGPFHLRTRREGDHISLQKSGKDLKSVLSDLGINGPERDRVLILSGRRGCIALICDYETGKCIISRPYMDKINDRVSHLVVRSRKVKTRDIPQ